VVIVALVAGAALMSLSAGVTPAAATGSEADFGNFPISVTTFGDVTTCLPPGDSSPNQPGPDRTFVGMAVTADGKGYWSVASNGEVFDCRDAAFYGSTGSIRLNQPVVGMAATPDGKGYWLVAADGGIFSFGDATFYGSMGGKALNDPVVGIASSQGGKGYWLVAPDGGIFGFGDVAFYGSEGGARPSSESLPTWSRLG
jgi:hypothetical protein